MNTLSSVRTEITAENSGFGSRLSKEALFLGVAFFLSNIASVIAFTTSPMLLQNLSTSTEFIGILETCVENLSAMARGICGSIGDRIRKRKIFIVVGYGFYTIARLLLAFFSSSVGLVVTAKSFEKLGNGIQASSREAIIGDFSNKHNAGANYGINRAMGMVGSFLGSILLFWIFLHDGNFKTAFQTACIPVALAFLMLFFIKDPQHLRQKKITESSPASAVPLLTLWQQKVLALCQRYGQFYQEKASTALHTSWGKWVSWPLYVPFFLAYQLWSFLRPFSTEYWKSLSVIMLFKMGYFSGFFLIFYLQKHTGLATMPWPLCLVQDNLFLAGPLVMIIQNFFCALLSFPLGRLSDKRDPRLVIAFGFCMLFISLFCLGFGHHWFFFVLSIVCYGAQMGVQGPFFALLSNAMPPQQRGTGFGLFHISAGLSMFVANKVVGALWETSHTLPFRYLCIPILLGLLGVLFLRPVTQVSRP